MNMQTGSAPRTLPQRARSGRDESEDAMVSTIRPPASLPVTQVRPETVTCSASTTSAITSLVAAIGVLSLFAALTGLFWTRGHAPATFTPLRGDPVELYGSGIYCYSTIFQAGANRGSDLVTLVLGIPLLVITFMLYRRGSRRGQLLLVGTLVYFLYTYASIALGTTYNNLFLVY